MRVPISDPLGASGDPALPTLAQALQPKAMARQLRKVPGLRPADGDRDGLGLQAIDVRHHKPGRRCLIEYRLAPSGAVGTGEGAAVLGKVRTNGLDRRSYEVQQALWRGGFGPDASISVPEPLGVLPKLNMWLQRRVAGVAVTERLSGPDGPKLAARIAAAIDKLQRSGVTPSRSHGMSDELRILHDQLMPVAAANPAWSARIRDILAASEDLAASLPCVAPRPSHRDFYADNVLVDGERLYIIDLDLYCQADPALDVGNFIGHVTEFSLRMNGDAAALAPVEQALESEYLARAGEAVRPAIRVYTTLTLVRHIAISTRIPERRSVTPKLLDLCEHRLGLSGA